MKAKQNDLSKETLKRFNDYKRERSYKINKHVSDRNPLTLTVKNPTNKELKINLFGATKNHPIPFGYVTPDFGINYDSVLKTLLSKNLYIEKIRVQGTTKEGALKTIGLFDENMYGQSFYEPINVQYFVSAYQLTLTIIEIDKNFTIDKQTSIVVTIPKKESVVYMFFHSGLSEFLNKLRKHSRSVPFCEIVNSLICDTKFILSQYDKNPYLHDEKHSQMYRDCEKISFVLGLVSKDTTFEFTLHKNLIDLHDALKPFVEKYHKVAHDSVPLYYDYLVKSQNESLELLNKQKVAESLAKKDKTMFKKHVNKKGEIESFISPKTLAKVKSKRKINSKKVLTKSKTK